MKVDNLKIGKCRITDPISLQEESRNLILGRRDLLRRTDIDIDTREVLSPKELVLCCGEWDKDDFIGIVSGSLLLSCLLYPHDRDDETIDAQRLADRVDITKKLSRTIHPDHGDTLRSSEIRFRDMTAIRHATIADDLILRLNPDDIDTDILLSGDHGLATRDL